MFKTLAFTLFVACVTFSSCKKDEEKTYSVVVTVNDPAMGVVNNVNDDYKENTEISLYATAQDGYHFVQWSDLNTENPRTIVVTKNISLIAIFAEGNGPGPGGLTNPETLSGSMSENRTLKDLGLPIDYIIDGTFYVEGNALLTIEDSVTIAFTGVDGKIVVTENAGLKMIGTAESPIVFQGPINNFNKGSWEGIVYNSSRPDNQMEYVIMKNGGSYDDGAVLNVESGAKLTVKNCTIDGSLGNGFKIYDAKSVTFENNLIKNIDKYPLFLEHNEYVNFLGTGNTFSDNGQNYILLNYNWISEDVTFNKQLIPYLFNSELTLDNAIMNVNAGVTLLFKANNDFDIEESAYIKAEGTAEEPIFIGGLDNEAGYWDGIYFNGRNTNQGGSFFKYTIISGAGSDEDNATLTLGYEAAKLTLENVTIENSTTYGIKASKIKWDDIIGNNVRDWSQLENATNVTFTNCAKGNIYHSTLNPGEEEIEANHIFNSIDDILN